jgi:hypothetical protein
MQASALLKIQQAASYQRVRKSTEGLSEAELKARPQGLTSVLWQVGHLAASDSALLGRAGVNLKLPEWLRPLYAKDSTGEGLTQSMAEIWGVFDPIQAALLELCSSDLDKPIDHPAKIYSNVGEGLLYMQIHRGYHHGKILTLKKLLGKL